MKIRTELLREVKSYADHTPEATPDILDCSIGTNPYGYSEVVDEAISKFKNTKLVEYPHSHDVHDAILNYWKGVSNSLQAENIVLTNGSLGGLHIINNIFRKPGANVLGFAPSFTNMVEDVELSGMKYCQINMSQGGELAQDVRCMMDELNEDYSFVYIDRPNNPTGQTMPLDQLDELVTKAESFGVAVVVDEAYGGFIPEAESAISLFDKHNNLIILRSFSKGLGLAGLRAGYVIAPAELTFYMRKVSDPYTFGEFARDVVAAAMNTDERAYSHAGEISQVKEMVRNACRNKLIVSSTDNRVPILTITHSDDNANLQELLYKNGVLAVSGAEFRNLGKNSVRIRTPRIENATRLIEAISSLEQK